MPQASREINRSTVHKLSPVASVVTAVVSLLFHTSDIWETLRVPPSDPSLIG